MADVAFRWIKKDGAAWRVEMRVPKSDGGGMADGGTFFGREDAEDEATTSPKDASCPPSVAYSVGIRSDGKLCTVAMLVTAPY